MVLEKLNLTSLIAKRMVNTMVSVLWRHFEYLRCRNHLPWTTLFDRICHSCIEYHQNGIMAIQCPCSSYKWAQFDLSNNILTNVSFIAHILFAESLGTEILELAHWDNILLTHASLSRVEISTDLRTYWKSNLTIIVQISTTSDDRTKHRRLKYIAHDYWSSLYIRIHVQ